MYISQLLLHQYSKCYFFHMVLELFSQNHPIPNMSSSLESIPLNTFYMVSELFSQEHPIPNMLSSSESIPLNTHPIFDTDKQLITLNITAQINDKLTPSIFPQQCAQFEALLIGYDLLDYVNDISSYPSPVGTSTTDLNKTHWVRQDKLIINVIQPLHTPESHRSQPQQKHHTSDRNSLLYQNTQHFYVVTLVKKNQRKSHYGFCSIPSIVLKDQLMKIVNTRINELFLFKS